MLSKKSRCKRNKASKVTSDEPQPVVYGPVPPPPPEPPKQHDGHQETVQGSSQNMTDATVDGQTVYAAAPRAKANKRKRKNAADRRPGTGFEAQHQDLPPHKDDVDRYDPTLPHDLRMLRAIDEWRSLRQLSSDQALNLRWLLSHLGIVPTDLRKKYGKQALCGETPDDQDDEDEEEEFDSDDEGGNDEAATNQKSEQAQIEEIDDEKQRKAEDIWAEGCLTAEAVARWLDDRANDFHFQTLTAAPQVLDNFVRFLLARKVLPLQEQRLDAILPLAALAKAQMASSGALFKQLPTRFMSAIAKLFPDTSSNLQSPIPDRADAETSNPVIPHFISAEDFVDETTDAGLDEDTQVLNLDGWPDYIHDEQGNIDSELIAQLKRVQNIDKGLSKEHEAAEVWKSTEVTREEALKEFKSILSILEHEVDLPGTWRVACLERSARSVVGWATAIKPARPTASGQHVMLVHLSPHNVDFPLTTKVTHGFNESSDAPRHNLGQPVSILLDLSTTSVAQLAKSVVFEADLLQLRFDAASPATDSSSATTSSSIWVPLSVFRIVPSYYALVGPEQIRDEPDRQRDFEGGWAVPEDEQLKRIVEAIERYHVKPEDGEGGVEQGHADGDDDVASKTDEVVPI